MTKWWMTKINGEIIYAEKNIEIEGLIWISPEKWQPCDQPGELKADTPTAIMLKSLKDAEGLIKRLKAKNTDIEDEFERLNINFNKVINERNELAKKLETFNAAKRLENLGVNQEIERLKAENEKMGAAMVSRQEDLLLCIGLLAGKLRNREAQ